MAQQQHPTTPDNALFAQHTDISAAIDMLSKALDEIKAPDTGAGWRDVAEHAATADAARALIARLRGE